VSSSVGAVSGQSVGAVSGGAVSGQCRLTLVSECRAVSEQCRSSVGQCRGFLTVDLLGQCRAVSARRSTRRPGQRPPLLAESLIVYKVFKTTDAALRMPLRLSQRHARGIQILKLPLQRGRPRRRQANDKQANDKPAAQITIHGGGGLVEVSGSLRRTPSRPPRSALGPDGVGAPRPAPAASLEPCSISAGGKVA
jgi:hypothetical protein